MGCVQGAPPDVPTKHGDRVVPPYSASLMAASKSGNSSKAGMSG